MLSQVGMSIKMSLTDSVAKGFSLGLSPALAVTGFLLQSTGSPWVDTARQRISLVDTVRQRLSLVDTVQQRLSLVDTVRRCALMLCKQV